VNIIAVGHNLISVYGSSNWFRLPNKMEEFVCAYNYLITEMNKKPTPVEDKIIELEAEIESLKNKK
jgi:flagellar capping protein FliD